MSKDEVEEIVNFVHEVGRDVINNGHPMDEKITDKFMQKHKEYNNLIKSLLLLACYQSYFLGAKDQSDRDINLISEKLFGGNNEN